MVRLFCLSCQQRFRLRRHFVKLLNICAFLPRRVRCRTPVLRLAATVTWLRKWRSLPRSLVFWFLLIKRFLKYDGSKIGKGSQLKTHFSQMIFTISEALRLRPNTFSCSLEQRRYAWFIHTFRSAASVVRLPSAEVRPKQAIFSNTLLRGGSFLDRRMDTCLNLCGIYLTISQPPLYTFHFFIWFMISTLVSSALLMFTCIWNLLCASPANRFFNTKLRCRVAWFLF